MRRHFGKLVVASAISLFCLPAPAQTDDGGSISDTGQVVLPAKATALRVHLSITVHGDDMQTTLNRLDSQGEAVRKALLKATADPKSIKLDGPKLACSLRALGDVISPQQYWGKGKAMQQQAPQQYPSQPPAPTPVETKRGPRIYLQSHVTAEWPLQAEAVPGLLVEADRIVLLVHEQIKQFQPERPPVQPHSSKYQDTFSEDEEQGLEDEEEQLQVVSAPNYLFVGRIAGEKVRQARVEAFEKAKAQAETVASIAGCRIGPLLGLSTSSSGIDDDDPFADPLVAYPSFSPYAPPPGLAPPSARNRLAPDNKESVEVAAAEPSGLRHIVSADATFRLLQPVKPSEANR